MFTHQDIKDMFYIDLVNDDTMCMSLDEYIRERYVPVYDAELDFIGFEVKS